MSTEISKPSREVLTLVPDALAAKLVLAKRSSKMALEGKAAWGLPEILPFNVWLRKLWAQIPMSIEYVRPLPLTAAQELVVWQEIIDASDWSRVLMQTASLARNAIQANRLLAEWQVSTVRLMDFHTDESRALRLWLREFDQRCTLQNWIPAYRLADFIQDLPPNTISYPAHIELHGFDELTPQQKSFFAHVESTGSKLRYPETDEQSGRNATRTAFADRQSEYEYAAAWARQRWNEDKHRQIVIALTDKNRQLDDIKRCLNREFYRGRQFPSLASDRYYDSAEPVSLASQPVIDIALKILSQSRHRVDLFEFGSLCQSPYISGSQAELYPRGQLDMKLRKLGERSPSLGFIAGQIFDRENNEYRVECPQFLEQLLAWRKLIDALPAKQGASAWANDFANLLNAIGWPGSFNGDATIQKILNQWDDVLSQLCTLEAVKSSWRFDEAISWVRRLASDATVPTPRQIGTIHIVSIEDAASLALDHVWVCGLDEEFWPGAARPNPLLPIGLQRDFQFPNATNDLVTRSAERVLGKLVQKSGEVIFSHALRTEDRVLGVSSLLSEIPQRDLSSFSVPSSTVAGEMVEKPAQREVYVDDPVPLHNGQATGGTSILKNQAACPFRAFVTHRLDSRIPEEPQAGLDASERGTLIHSLMEIVWSRLESHSGLVSTDEAELEHIVYDAAQTALQKFIWSKPETLTPKFREIELERLTALVLRWLHYEAGRESFTVLHPEYERVIDLAGLKMKIFIDRIDQDEIGRHIILDYKTGATRTSSWFGERPDEPQLPLYAVSEAQAGNELAALAFAQIRSAEISFSGISKEDGQLPGVSTWAKQRDAKLFDSWEAVLEGWRASLEKLAADFVAGIAPIDPKNASTCTYCDLPGVCRIHELRTRLGLLEEEDGEGNE